MARTIYVINGPNLNILGVREPELYGHETLADIERDCAALCEKLGLQLRFHQSNAEHEIIEWLQEARENAAGIAINPAGYTHTSVAIGDAIMACDCPIVEVHLSNIHAREAFRRHSYVSPVAAAVIIGCGTQGYRFAIERISKLIEGAVI